jgi:hypothetical protein
MLDGIYCVKDKMRVHLAPQCAHFGLQHLLLPEIIFLFPLPDKAQTPPDKDHCENNEKHYHNNDVPDRTGNFGDRITDVCNRYKQTCEAINGQTNGKFRLRQKQN